MENQYETIEIDEEPHKEITMDEALERMGGFSKFQIFHTLLLGFLQICNGMMGMSMIFTAQYDAKGEPVPNSMPDEYGLTGDRKWLAAFSNSLFFVGWLLGSGICGYLSDKYGRKPVVIFTSLLASLSGIISSFTFTFEQYLLARTIQGAGIGGGGLVLWVLATEFWPQRSRPVMGCAWSSFYASGIALMAAISYHSFFDHWRILIRTFSFPTLCIFLFMNHIHESPRWLLVHGFRKLGYGILNVIGRRNGFSVPSNIESGNGNKNPNNGEENGLKRPKITVIDLIRTPRMRSRTLIMWYLWFTAALLYYGLHLYAGNLKGNIHTNVVISALLEFPAWTVAMFAVRFGRRIAIFSFFGYTSVCLLSVLMVNGHTTFLAMAGKLGISAAFTAIYLTSAELFPTTLRSLGTGISSLIARIGGIISPFIVAFVGQPLIVFGVFCLFGLLLIVFLPETIGKPMPNTVAQIENDVVGAGWVVSQRAKPGKVAE